MQISDQFDERFSITGRSPRSGGGDADREEVAESRHGRKHKHPDAFG
jgi:hypothetical protein